MEYEFESICDPERASIEAFNAANPDKAARITWPGRKATA